MQQEEEPRDAKVVKSLLKSMGVEQYEPRVVNQFLELWYRYVADVLTDAQTFSEHAGKSAIDADDLLLAVQSKANFSFNQPPPREQCIKYFEDLYSCFDTIYFDKQVLLELSRSRNRIPLPRSISGPGIALPPEQDTLISPNYQLEIPRKVNSQAIEEMEIDEEEGNKVEPGTSFQEHKTDQDAASQRISFSLSGKRSR